MTETDSFDSRFDGTFAVDVAAQHLLLRTIEPAFAREAHAVLVANGTHLGDWHSADHLASLALGATHPALNGGCVELGKARRSAPQSYDAARESRLRDVLEQLTAPFLQQSRANAAEYSVVESLAGN